MDNKKERNLTVIENTKTEEKVEKKADKLRQTNPIAKKLLEFHNSKVKKFSVKDLFKQ